MPDLNYDAGKFWIDLVQTIFLAAVGLYGWISGRHRVTEERLKGLAVEMEGRLDDHGDRITRVEAYTESLPTHTDMGKLYESINAVRSSVDQMTGEMKGVKSSLTLIHQHLLEERKQ